LIGIVLALNLIGCELEPNEETPLDGTWVRTDSSAKVVFGGSNFTLLHNDGTTFVNAYTGTYYVKDGKYYQQSTHGWSYGSWVSGSYEQGVCDISISSDSFTITRNGGTGWADMSNWSITYIRQ
jgi:hypothetical protein